MWVHSCLLWLKRCNICPPKQGLISIWKAAPSLFCTALSSLWGVLKLCFSQTQKHIDRHIASVVKSTQLLYLSKSKDILIENDSSKIESHPVKYYLSKILKVFGFKYTKVSKVNVIDQIYLTIKSKSKSINNFKFLILSNPHTIIKEKCNLRIARGTL
jgi:hypothetical protein